jgi:hypothetical protein
LHRRRGSPPHILFEHGTLETHLRLSYRQYDIGVISFVLHEMGAHLRVPLLRSLAGSVGLVILADFRVPRVKGLKKGMNELVEFCAGPDHYRGFRSFVTSGGLLHLVREADLQSLGEQPCSNPCAQVLHVSGLRPQK